MANPAGVVRLRAVAAPERSTEPAGPRVVYVNPNPKPRRSLRGVWSVWPAVLGLVAYFALRQVLDPWLNASSDAKFWTAAAIIAAPVVFSLFAIARAIRAPRRP
jgi:hypothetical protein